MRRWGRGWGERSRCDPHCTELGCAAAERFRGREGCHRLSGEREGGLCRTGRQASACKLRAGVCTHTSQALEQRYPGETVLLCSHGGPCAHAHQHLLGDRATTGLVAGCTNSTAPRPHAHSCTQHTRCQSGLAHHSKVFNALADTALYIFVRGEDGRWNAPYAADQTHLKGLAS